MRISDWSSDVCSSDLAADDTSAGRSCGKRPVVLGEAGLLPVKLCLSLVECLAGCELLSAYSGLCGVGDHVTGPSQLVPVSARKCINGGPEGVGRSEEHTSELQSLMRSSYAVLCLKKKT